MTDPVKRKLNQKALCKWDKSDIKKNLGAIYELTIDPNFVCQKCARVSHLKANVCHPHPFEKARG
jgi:hypothetical protein